MSITTEITRLTTAKADIKSVIEAKGVTVPSSALISAYPQYISQISGGGGGGSAAVPIVEHTASETTVSIEPNVFHIWPQMSSLNITLATPEDLTIVNQYTFEFTSGSTATTLSLPSGILWPKGNPLTSPEANMIYEINIRNNKATWSSWEVTS